MNVTIDREKFKQLLLQFKGDIPYQTELVNTLLNQMPDNYIRDLINTLYYERVYQGDYYIVQHSVYSYDKHYCKTFSETLDYINSIRVDDSFTTKGGLVSAIEKGKLVAGYKIIKVKKGVQANA